MYFSLERQGFTNREIAKLLDVDEASVRRGLKGRPVWPDTRPEPTVIHVRGIRVCIE